MSAAGANSGQGDEGRRLAGLISRIAAGDRDALAEIYDLTSRQVFGLVLRIVGDRAAAEEVTLDVYTQVWRQANRFDAGRGSGPAWLLLMARSRALDRVRSKAGRTQERETALEPTAEVAAETPAADQTVWLADRKKAVRSALESLEGPKRQAIELAFFSGLSHTEIAERLATPLGTIKTRIRSGMMQLRDALGPFSEGL